MKPLDRRSGMPRKIGVRVCGKGVRPKHRRKNDVGTGVERKGLTGRPQTNHAGGVGGERKTLSVDLRSVSTTDREKIKKGHRSSPLHKKGSHGGGGKK